MCSDVPDAYSSVMYSLGLSGSGHLSGMVGSLMYMAPEVVKGQQYTEKVILRRGIKRFFAVHVLYDLKLVESIFVFIT